MKIAKWLVSIVFLIFGGFALLLYYQMFWSTGEKPLHFAIGMEYIPAAKTLITLGADINAKNSYGEIPLSIAAVSGSNEMVQLLITKGAEVDPKAKNSHGWTLLYSAARGGVLSFAEQLIAKGADINAKTKWGTTPLFEAARKGNSEMIQLMISKGAEVDPKMAGASV